MDEKTADLLKRAGHTFWQAFVSYIVISAGAALVGVTDAASFKTALIGLVVAALGAALSAMKTAVINTSHEIEAGGTDE